MSLAATPRWTGQHESLAPARILWDTWSVPRALFVLFFALLTFQVSGLGAMCADESCDEDCPSDNGGGQCAPNCHFCSCSPLPTFAKPAVVITDVQLSCSRSSWLLPTDARPAPDPAAILHVPKALLG